jgi:hypothetical protein
MAPALSIVVTGRNDNYGGDFNDRFFTTLRFNQARLKERGVAFEVVFVEWNPIPDRPYLADLLAREFPELAGSALRTFVAAPEYHAAFSQNRQIPYFEYIGKNIGIRRAAAPFILVTNTDVLLGREVVETIASARMQPGTIYRSARYDIKLGIDSSALRWDTLEDPANLVDRSELRRPLLSHGSGDFMLADADSFRRLQGFNEVYRVARAGVDQNFLAKAYGAGYPIEEINGPVYHINHVGSFRISKGAHAGGGETPWGKLGWPARYVTYNNPDGWGLRDAPARPLPQGATFLDFDWKAVPPLVELRRLVLTAKAVEEAV